MAVGMGGWADGGLLAVDWGSTARRAYLLNSHGTVVDELEDAAGMLTTPRDRFPALVALLRKRFGSVPLLLAGMVGADRGWMEAPYVSCPTTVADLARELLWAEPGRTAIVPGLSLIEAGRADVMRGEEVQVFGLMALEADAGERLICHPGTHTKWIATQGGALTRFRTVMTGELFGLIRRHSILASMLEEPVTPGPAFARGVRRGLAGVVPGAELFGVRAGVLLGEFDRADASAFVSGLLIGGDLRAGFADSNPACEIVVLGRGSLTQLYAAAIETSGRRAREVDGASAFVAGMRAVAELIA